MWPRIAEIFLGLWLVISPFVFESSSDRREWWTVELASGLATILLASVSLLTPFRRAHLAIFVIAVALAGYAYLSGPQAAPVQQNDILVGLILMMLAIVPSEASLPPRSRRA